MDVRRLGKTGLSVSGLGLGCMGMSQGYGPGDDDESIRTLHRSVDLGVTFFDTAAAYGNGVNEQLIGKGRNLRVFDPHIQLDAIYGSNRDFILHQIPHIGRLLVSNPEAVLEWADQLVVTQKLAPELAEAVLRSGLPVLDLAGTGVRPSKQT